MIETTLLATSEKLWPSACRIFGGPRNSSDAIGGEEGFDRGAAFGGAQVGAVISRGPSMIVSTWLTWSNAVRRLARRSFFISIRKCVFDR